MNPEDHKPWCRFRRAANCPVAVECDHGRDVCPICDPCTCADAPTVTVNGTPTAMQESAKKQTSSAGRWWGRSVIYGKEDEAKTPYMTRYWIGRLRLHVFHRGDQDPDCHDHPWDFWTFPLTSYVEEFLLPNRFKGGYDKHRQIVPAFRWSFRPAEHTHRVLGRAVRITEPCDDATICYHDGRAYGARPGPIVTIVWRSTAKRAWGFLKNRDGKWCWMAWREYVFGGGKSAPCE